MNKTNALERVKHNAKLISALGSTGVLTAASILPALAAGDNPASGVTINEPETGLDDKMGTVIGFVTTIFRYIGILLAVWGIAQLVLAFKNEDADSKSRAMMVLVASIILIFIKTIVEKVVLD